MGTRQQGNTPLWKAGSHLGRHPTGADASTRATGGSRGSRANPYGLSEQFNIPDVPDEPKAAMARGDHDGFDVADRAVAEPGQSGVFGVYEHLPQATCRLFENFMDKDRARTGTRRGSVPHKDGTGIFLRAVLSTPVYTTSFVA